MNLIKTSFYTSISQLLSIAAGLVSVKVVSSKIGPEGMAMVGQFMNTTTLLTLFATGALGVAIVKYLAQYKDDKDFQLKIIRTGFIIMICCSLLIGTGVAFGARFFSTSSFKSQDYQLVYVVWGLFLVITTLSSFFSSVLNGLKLIKYLTIVNISSTLAGLFITIVMAHYYGVAGVLLSSNFTTLTLFCLHLFFLNKYKWFSYRDLFGRPEMKILKLFFSFILMTLVSGLLVPAIQLLVRNRIIERFSFTEAGYWQSVTRISDYYLGFITSVLAVYYLPKLSELNNKSELRKEVIHGYKLILPVVAILSLTIWFSRYLIIKILLNDHFLPSADLYGFQFLGDFFKIASWLIAYLMIAKGLRNTFIISEILFSATYVGLSFLFIHYFGLVGSVYGFCASYFLYMIAIFFVIKKQKII